MPKSGKTVRLEDMNAPALSRSYIDLDTGCRQFVHVPSLLREGTTEVFAVSDKRRVLMELPKGVSIGQEILASRCHIDAQCPFCHFK